jgi:hypothetical protein
VKSDDTHGIDDFSIVCSSLLRRLLLYARLRSVALYCYSVLGMYSLSGCRSCMLSSDILYYGFFCIMVLGGLNAV